MKKYAVTLVLGSTVTVTVRADSQEKAAQKALDVAETPCLCPYCEAKVQLGEFSGDVFVETLQ